jgi:hypothetical protein
MARRSTRTAVAPRRTAQHRKAQGTSSVIWLGQVVDRLNEIGERLRVIESDIEKMQRHVGILTKHIQVPVLPELGPGPLEPMEDDYA